MFPMDQSEYPSSGKSPRRELQGPRPTPLKLRKDSHKIKKPPVAPHQHHHQQPQPQPQPPRPPVIIYTVSPKVIHANPSEFMTLVQRLTGPGSTCASTSVTATSSSYPSCFPFQENISFGAGGVSPAARFASTEKTRPHEWKNTQVCDMGMVDGIDISTEVERTGFFSGYFIAEPGFITTYTV